MRNYILAMLIVIFVTMGFDSYAAAPIVASPWTTTTNLSTARDGLGVYSKTDVDGRIENVVINGGGVPDTYVINYVNVSTNRLASTNYVNTATNGLASTTYVNTATNRFANYASTNYVNTATNGFTTTAYVNAATNGFANYASTNYVNTATNGFANYASTNYVNTATNGFANYASTNYVNNYVNTATNGFANYASTNYVNTATNGFANYASTNYVNTATNGFANYASTNYVNTATNGFANYASTNYVNTATNGFANYASTNYVNTATNGFANYASTNYVNNATNGFANYASTNYVNTATNGFANYASTNYVNTATNGFANYASTNYVNTVTNNIDAAKITVGNLSLYRFNGSNNASASTFWRGDGTWATPVGGTGGLQTGNSNDATNVNLTVTGNFIASNQTNTTLSVSNAYFAYTNIAAGFDANGKLIGTNAHLTADNTLSNNLVTTIIAATNNIDAGKITVGNFGTNLARFNNGSGASSTTFWRGDGTWATPSAGTPGSNYRTLLTMTTNVINANATANTLSNITELSFAVTAGTCYRYQATIFYASVGNPTSAIGSRWTATGPAMTSFAGQSEYSSGSGNSQRNPALTTTSFPTTATSFSGSVANANFASLTGIFVPSADGTFSISFASAVSSLAITALKGSTLEYW